MVLDFPLGDAPERETAGYQGEDEMAGSPWWMPKEEVNCVPVGLDGGEGGGICKGNRPMREY